MILLNLQTKKQKAMPVLLDLSAAFGTIDKLTDFFYCRLETYFGLRKLDLKWLNS